jgi:hypothetical protein
MKGLSALAKRSKSGRKTLKIEFSAKLTGRCEEDRRTFLNEIVVHTWMKAPLIIVGYWNDSSPDVSSQLI